MTTYPGMGVLYNERLKPAALKGRFWLPDDTGRAMGQWDIEILIPANYPYGFPVLIETSGHIPADSDRHMGANRVACTELDFKANLRARQGITLIQFMKEYVVRYFCWQVLYETGHKDSIQGWLHGADGIREFFYEQLGTEDHFLIRRALLAATGKGRIGRNSSCFCDSGNKYKRCHQRVMNHIVLAVGPAAVPQTAKLFSP